MRIGSGDVYALLSGKNTKTHQALLERFVTGNKPYYNALNSPIDALRTGAILEEKYHDYLPDNYFTQYEVTCDEMDVFRAHIDFAKLENGKVVDFDELKSCNIDDYLEIQSREGDDLLKWIKRYYKSYYNQIQQQLLCSGLDSANLVFLGVTTYDDEENRQRVVKDHELKKVRIQRDEEVISLIKEKGKIFQQIKDYYESIT